jgi:hypothetical protein
MFWPGGGLEVPPHALRPCEASRAHSTETGGFQQGKSGNSRDLALNSISNKGNCVAASVDAGGEGGGPGSFMGALAGLLYCRRLLHADSLS